MWLRSTGKRSIDVGKIITLQIPDANGQTIPPGTTLGSYELDDLDDTAAGSLYEGKLQIDRTNGFVTYGCSLCCYFDDAYISDFMGVPSDSGPLTLWASNSCTGTYQDQTAYGTSWSSWNARIATVAGPSASAVSVGGTSSSSFVNQDLTQYLVRRYGN